MNKLEEVKFKTVTCYLTQENLGNPRQLFRTKRKRWDKPTNIKFNISSKIETQLLPGTILSNKIGE